jgi:16S rRNA (uracil1498-N3)-methyltransferase
MSQRYYINSAISLGQVLLQGPEAHHLTVALFDGTGAEFVAEVVGIARKQVALDVVERLEPDRERPHQLIIGAPLPKGDRGMFMIEKLTELGVAEYVPLRTRRSVVDPGDAKLERLERAVIEASKQCGRNILMKIHLPMDWNSFLTRAELPEQRLIAIPTTVAQGSIRHGATVFAVGPEGGFTEEEITEALKANWSAISLGPRVLRIETAAMALAAQGIAPVSLE